MRILLTGASGFVGGHVARQLDAGGHTILAGLRDPTATTKIDGVSQFVAIKLDLERPETIAASVNEHRPDVVVHCAAYGVDYRQQDVARAVDTNVKGTLLLAHAAKAANVSRFVHIGTAYEYGRSDAPLGEHAPLAPCGIYGATKAAATIMLREFAEHRGLAVVMLRPFSLFGPGEGEHKLIPQIIRAVRTGESLEMGPATEIRDYMYVGDAARAIAAVATIHGDAFSDGCEFNICSGRGIAIADLATKAARLAGNETVLQIGALPDRQGDLAKVVGDATRWRSWCKCTQRMDLLETTPLSKVIALMRDL